MKKLIIVGTYITDTTTTEILKQNILQLKKLNIDILIVSHSTIPSEIIENVNYYIYDYNNITPDDFLVFWTETDTAFVETYYKNHSLAIMRNVNIALNFAKNLDYDFFYYCEYDNIFSDIDLNKINELESILLLNNKKIGVFGEDNGRYQTIFFFGYIENFMNNFYLPKTKEEWQSKYTGPFEDILYSELQKHKNDIFEFENIFEYFNNSSKIAYHVCVQTVAIINNKDNEKIPLLYIYNFNDVNKLPYKIYNIYINNSLVMDAYISLNNYYVYPIDLSENDSVLVSVYYDNKKIFEQIVEKNKLSLYKLNGNYKLKNN